MKKTHALPAIAPTPPPENSQPARPLIERKLRRQVALWNVVFFTSVLAFLMMAWNAHELNEGFTKIIDTLLTQNKALSEENAVLNLNLLQCQDL